jgi:hypothetical protein
MFDPFKLIGAALPWTQAQLTGDLEASEREINALLAGLADRSRSDPVTYAPYNVTRDSAIQGFHKWLQGRRFVPGALKKTADLGDMKAVYVPFWVISGLGFGYYVGERGKRYQESENYTDSSGETKTRQVTRTDWTSAFGTVQEHFEQLIVCGLPDLNPKFVSILEPRNLPDHKNGLAEEIKEAPLEAFALDARAALTKARAEMDRLLQEKAKKDIGGDEQKVNYFQSRHTSISIRRVYVPAYLGSYHFRGRPYGVAVNAATGDITGEAPTSIGKVLLLVLGILLGLAAIIGLVVFFMTRR